MEAGVGPAGLRIDDGSVTNSFACCALCGTPDSPYHCPSNKELLFCSLWCQKMVGRDEGTRFSATLSPNINIKAAMKKHMKKQARNEEDQKAYTRLQVGKAFLRLGWHDKAESYLRTAMGIYQSMDGKTHASLASVMYHLGVLYHDTDRLDESLRMHERCLAACIRQFGEVSAPVANSLNAIGHVLRRQGLLEKALVSCSFALNVCSRAVGRTDESNARILRNIGVICRDLGRLIMETGALEEAMAVIQGSSRGCQSQEAAEIRMELGVVKWERGWQEAGVLDWEEGVALLLSIFGEDHPAVIKALKTIKLTTETPTEQGGRMSCKFAGSAQEKARKVDV